MYLHRLLQSESATTFPYRNITLYIATFFATATVFATAAVYTVILRLWYVESELIQVSFKIGEVLHLIWLPSQTISTLKLLKNIQVKADGIGIVWVKKEISEKYWSKFSVYTKFLKMLKAELVTMAWRNSSARTANAKDKGFICSDQSEMPFNS